MTAKSKWDTPLLDELEKGPWPSFVKELKKSAGNPMTSDLLGLLERSGDWEALHHEPAVQQPPAGQ